MKSHLTDISIRKLAFPDQGQVTVWDRNTPGFGVRLSPKSKSFVVMYGQKRRLKTLGRYPTLGLSDARKQARRFLVDVEAGVIPPSKEETTLFSEVKERFLEDCQGRNKERTIRDYTRLLNRHFTFTRPISEIDRRMIMKVISSLSKTPSEQSHAYVALRTMMNWAVKHGYIESNPVPVIKQHKQSRNRILSEEELKRVFERAKKHPYPYGPIVQLIILTGQRRSEIASLRRSWIQGGSIVFPAGFTKNKREHTIPLGEMAATLIEQLPNTGDLLFPARGQEEKPFNGWGKCKKRFDLDLEDVVPYTLHDLRRTYSSAMARLGAPIHVTEKLLNHVSGTISGVAAVYNRYSYFDEMKEAVEQYESYLETISNHRDTGVQNQKCEPGHR